MALAAALFAYRPALKTRSHIDSPSLEVAFAATAALACTAFLFAE